MTTTAQLDRLTILPPPPHRLEDMSDKLAQIARTAQALERTREQLETEILEALEGGMPLRQVAKAANLSRPTIYSIRDRKAGNEKITPTPHGMGVKNGEAPQDA